MDPDFGWHLRTGQLILERGVPYYDWYSYTMPNFPWIDHEWLSDVFIYGIFSHVGFYFLLLIFLFFYTLSFFIVKRPGQKSWEFFLPLFLGYLGSVGFLGIRPQLLSIFFITVLLNLIYRYFDQHSKLLFLLPVIFLLWVNLHAGFFAGLTILAIVFCLEIFKKSQKE
ncbi:MAG: hypothetical protein NT094_03105, partial [Candidatus Staskawiczbacteria bacterium]|nr:hypothetical protein [Candidatus Staskawiczbacteria bacterium]